MGLIVGHRRAERLVRGLRLGPGGVRLGPVGLRLGSGGGRLGSVGVRLGSGGVRLGSVGVRLGSGGTCAGEQRAGQQRRDERGDAAHRQYQAHAVDVRVVR
ncbi:hypothetical protein [Streptomyces sp. NPDC020996]|uniref:hypothetical protein n=1 Tax=Streptomyces sp. NPDC020996 TaxID=3154791 RepID=UPI0033EEB81B